MIINSRRLEHYEEVASRAIQTMYVKVLVNGYIYVALQLLLLNLMQIAQLCFETAKNGHSVLVFCSSKNDCSKTVKNICNVLEKRDQEVLFFFLTVYFA